MHHSSWISVISLCAYSSLLVHCGGSDRAGTSNADAGGSSPSSNVGGAGGGSSNSTGGTGQNPAGAVVLVTGSSDKSGFNDGAGALGLLVDPSDLVSDGTHLYILEGYQGNRVRSLEMSSGLITTIAGSGDEACEDGVGSAAKFNNPDSFTLDPLHENLYVADKCGIRKVVVATGQVSTFAASTLLKGSGIGDGSALGSAIALAFDSTGSHLYVADGSAHQIRVIDLGTSQMSTVAGSVTEGWQDGVGSAATLCYPKSLAIDPTDTKLYFADTCDFDLVRVVDLASHEVATVAGSATMLNFDDGVGASAGFSDLRSITIDSTGSNLYTSEANRCIVRKVEIGSATVTTIVGKASDCSLTNAKGTSARLNFPIGLAVVGNSLYIADSGNEEVRKFALDTNEVTTCAGDKNPATFNDPVNAASDGTYLYVVDKNNNAIRKVSMDSGYTTTLAGTGAWGALNGAASSANFNFPSGIAHSGSRLYVADAANHEIRTIDLLTNQVTTLAGSQGNKGATDGAGTAALFNAPQGLVADPKGENLYVTDQSNHEIRKIVITTGQVTTFAGAPESGFIDGVGTAARFNMPANIAVDAKGTTLYVTDASNDAIRQIDIASVKVTTIAGSPTVGNTDGIGAAARFDTPWGIVTDGSSLYVADAANGIIRKIDLATSAVSLLCGRRLFDYEDGTCAKALFQMPAGLALDATATWLYVCESAENQIRRVRLK